MGKRDQVLFIEFLFLIVNTGNRKYSNTGSGHKQARLELFLKTKKVKSIIRRRIHLDLPTAQNTILTNIDRDMETMQKIFFK